MESLVPAAPTFAALFLLLPTPSAANALASAVAPASIPDGNPTFIPDGNPTFIQDGNPTFIQAGIEAPEALNRYLESLEGKVEELAKQPVPTPVEWIDGRSLAAAIAGSPTAYARTCKGNEDVCRAFEDALGSAYAQSLGHHLHVAAVSHEQERFSKEPVFVDDELGSVRIRIDLEPGGPVDENAAWYPPQGKAPSLRLDVDLRRPSSGGPYTVRDYTLAGKSFTHAMRNRLHEIVATPGKPQSDGWTGTAAAWVSEEDFFATEWFVHPQNGAALSEAMVALAAAAKPTMEAWK